MCVWGGGGRPPAMTSCGLKEAGFEKVAAFLHEGDEGSGKSANEEEREGKQEQSCVCVVRFKPRNVTKRMCVCAQASLSIQATSGKMLKDFQKALEGNETIASIRARVEEFAASFPMPGFDLP